MAEAMKNDSGHHADKIKKRKLLFWVSLICFLFSSMIFFLIQSNMGKSIVQGFSVFAILFGSNFAVLYLVAKIILQNRLKMQKRQAQRYNL